MLPVPTTDPRQVNSTASEEEKVPCAGRQEHLFILCFL